MFARAISLHRADRFSCFWNMFFPRFGCIIFLLQEINVCLQSDLKKKKQIRFHTFGTCYLFLFLTFQFWRREPNIVRNVSKTEQSRFRDISVKPFKRDNTVLYASTLHHTVPTITPLDKKDFENIEGK